MISSGKWILSILLAYVISQGLFPTPNVAGGGGASMVMLLVLTVLIKASLDFLAKRWRKKPGKPDRDPN